MLGEKEKDPSYSLREALYEIIDLPCSSPDRIHKDHYTVEEMRNKLDEISDLNMNEMVLENF